MIIDTHTHILDERFDRDREAVIASLKEKGIELIVENATDSQDMIKVAKLTEKYENVYGAVGIHPHSADEYDDEAQRTIEQLARRIKIIAIGEIGLDYHYDFCPRKLQKEVFEKQALLAKSLDLPMIVHSREAAGDTFEIVKKTGARGEIHCFSGSAQMAEEYVKLGYYIGFGGAITFKNARKLLEAVEAVPIGRIVIETDCPYMTPEPFRGKRNEPSLTEYTAMKICEIKNMTLSEVKQITSANAKKLFGILG